MKDIKSITLKTLTKSNVWSMQENDVFRLLQVTDKEEAARDNIRHYLTIFKTAFEIEELKVDSEAVVQKYENRGFQIGVIRVTGTDSAKVGIKKRPILRVTDLTYENIRHISAEKLMEVIDRNFGGGWESLSQSIQDIIQSGFDISTTTLPKDRLHKPGGMYEKKVADGFAVLEIEKGAWIEAIFAKLKPEAEKPRMKYDDEEEVVEEHDDEELPEVEDNYKRGDDDEDDSYDDDMMTEESYRTTIEEHPEDLDLSASDVADDEEY